MMELIIIGVVIGIFILLFMSGRWVRKQKKLSEKEPLKGRRKFGFYIAQILRALFIVFVLLFVLTAGGLFLVEIPFRLLAGWIIFIAKKYPEITWSWNAVIPGLAALIMLSLGLHAFMKWLCANWGKAADDGAAKDPAPVSPDKVWKQKWTLAMLALFMLMFSASIGFIGVVHQVGWLVNSEEPVIVSQGGWAKRAYDSDAKSNLHNIYLGCKAFWADTESHKTCNVEIASRTTYGFIQSRKVAVLAGGDEISFLAWAHHSDSDKIFRMDANGKIEKESVQAKK